MQQQQQAANPANMVLVALCLAIIMNLFIFAPMVAAAIIMNIVALHFFGLEFAGGLAMSWTLAFMFLGAVSLVALLAQYWGWWDAHKPAKHAISKTEAQWYRVKLYGAMTLTLALVILVMQVPFLLQ